MFNGNKLSLLVLTHPLFMCCFSLSQTECRWNLGFNNIFVFQGMKQMRIDVNARRIYQTLYHGRGHIYVSGDFTLANDVKSAVVSIFQKYGNITANVALSAVESLIVSLSMK